MAGTETEVPWKRFEQIVRRIEGYLAPRGAVVILNDRIRDKKTGQLRQIDTSIRYPVGSVEILITIECRRHTDPQDVTWIEQLAKKRENVGANATIAVASAGFFRTAGVSAGFENVYPRTLEELERPGELDWLRLTHIDVVVKTYSVRQIGVELDDLAESDQLVYDEQLRASNPNRLDLYPLFIHAKTGKRYDCYKPIHLSERQGADWFEGNVLGVEVVRHLKWENHDRGIGVETNNGIKPVRFIYLKFATKLERHQIPADSVFRYSKSEGKVLEGAEFDMAPAVPGHLLALYLAAERNQIDISLMPKNSG